MSRRYKSYSKVVVIDGEEVVPGLVGLQTDYKGAEIFHEVNVGEVSRLDILSYIYYDTPENWWIIGLYNKIHNPMFEIQPGTVVRIPTDLVTFKASMYRVG